MNEPLIVCAPHNFLFFSSRFFSGLYSLVAVDKSQKYTLNLNNWNFELFLTFRLSFFHSFSPLYSHITLSHYRMCLSLFSACSRSIFQFYICANTHTVRCIRFMYLAFQRCISKWKIENRGLPIKIAHMKKNEKLEFRCAAGILTSYGSLFSTLYFLLLLFRSVCLIYFRYIF